jgi:hypothetical protein
VVVAGTVVEPCTGACTGVTGAVSWARVANAAKTAAVAQSAVLIRVLIICSLSCFDSL